MYIAYMKRNDNTTGVNLSYIFKIHSLYTYLTKGACQSQGTKNYTGLRQRAL